LAKYFLYRLLAFIPKLFIISIIIFISIQLMPGDPVLYLIPFEQRINQDPAQVALLREALGLNAPAVIRYFHWLGDMLSGNLGYSLVSGAKITDLLAQRIPATLELCSISLLFSSIVGLLFGFFSAIRQNTFVDYINTALGIIFISVPEFFFGLTGIMFFSINLKWLPTGGRMAPGKEAFFNRLEFLVLPCICLGLALVATLMRYTRGSMLDVLNKDYIRTSRAKGVGRLMVQIKHGFRNALTPVVIILTGRLTFLVSGAVIVENVFNYPGMGTMLLNAMNGKDMPVIMVTTFLITVVILFSSLLIDLAAAALDPRIRFGKQ